jgi:hypothetical protein
MPKTQLEAPSTEWLATTAARLYAVERDAWNREPQYGVRAPLVTNEVIQHSLETAVSIWIAAAEAARQPDLFTTDR